MIPDGAIVLTLNGAQVSCTPSCVVRFAETSGRTDRWQLARQLNRQISFGRRACTRFNCLL
jgi:hypothetical protein